MAVYICLLRGVNVGGHRHVDMKALKRLFVEMGHEDVTTYIQSGNVVFGGPRASPAKLAANIEERIAGDLGVNGVRALVRTSAELADAAAANPFLERGEDVAKLYVTFLDKEPDPSRRGAVDPAAFEPDEFELRGREIYLRYPTGYGRSKLNNGLWEKRLGVAATTRNWNTVTKLLGLAGG